MSYIDKVSELTRKHKWVFYITLVILFLFVLFIRRPDALLTPQFWAEDGKHWFGQAYLDGPIRSISLGYAGSPQVLMRLIGSFSLLFPFSFVPLFFTLFAMLVQLTPALFIHTKRFRPVFPNVYARWALTILYLSMPNFLEAHANLTNVGWIMALLSFLVLIAPSTRSKFWRVIDISILILSGLTGPFVVFLSVPALIVYVWNRKEPGRLTNLVVVGSLAICQFLFLVFGGAADRKSDLSSIGASFPLFIKILGKRVFGVSMLGNPFALSGTTSKYVLSLFCIFGITILTVAFIKGSRHLKLFLAFAYLVFIGALLSPAMGGTWQIILTTYNDRYMFLPALGLLVAAVWLAGTKKVWPVFRGLAILLLLMVVLVGIPRSFRYTPRRDLNFQSYAQKFKSLHKGGEVCFPVNPDNGWLTCLTKK